MTQKTNRRTVSPIDAEIGFRIRRARQSLKLTQRSLAAQLGISSQQFQKYEQGLNRIPIARLLSVARILQVEPATLLDTSARSSQEKSAACPRVIPLSSATMSIDTQAYDLWHQLGSVETKHLVLDLMQTLCAVNRAGAKRVSSS